MQSPQWLRGRKHVRMMSLAPCTIDPKIHRRLVEKGVTQDALMDYLESPI